jgi:uncharacterized membrane protein YphA (DoxX/SURF4 family)
MKAKNIAYWITTGLVGAAYAFGGVMDLSGSAQVREGMAHLGYPAYFATILGAWKLLGALALLAPGLPRLKEWAYAGIVFNLTSAAISHLASGDGVGQAAAPLVLTGLAFASWALRPPTRILGALPLGAAQPEAPVGAPAAAS